MSERLIKTVALAKLTALDSFCCIFVGVKGCAGIKKLNNQQHNKINKNRIK